MKKIISLTVLCFASYVCFSQSVKPPQTVFEEFSRQLKYANSTNDALKHFLIQTIRRQNPSYTTIDVGLMIDNVAINPTSQRAIFKAFYEKCDGRSSCLEEQLMVLQMKAPTSQILATYIQSIVEPNRGK